MHSYHIEVEQTDDIMTTTLYGSEFVSGIKHKNIYATQFHPEKSSKYGLQLISNFITWSESFK